MTTTTTGARQPSASKSGLLACLALMLLPPCAFAQGGEESRQPLRVEDIRCAGNARTSCDFIRDHLRLASGAALDEEEIRNAELRLSASRNFDSVAIRLQKGTERGRVIVVIDVTENSPVTTEWVTGGSHRLDASRVLIGGRVAHHNLFGGGKFADFTAVAGLPLGGDGRNESYDVMARYVDPMLFGSRRWFGVATAAWHKQDYEDQYGTFAHVDTADIDLSIGWRFADFSYLTSGITWRPGIELSTGRWLRDRTFDLNDGRNLDYSLNIAYGWSSEDDLLFPRRGSTLQLGLSADFGDATGLRLGATQFRKTWAWQNAFWTLKIGGDPNPEYRVSISESQLFAFTFARPLRTGDSIRQARWYIEPGYGLRGFDDQGRHVYEAGLKVGYRADTRAFGYIDLYLIGSADVNK